MSPKSLHHTLEEPHRPDCIPKNSQWLAGEGAGSWFHIYASKDKFTITRYNPHGKIECFGIFEVSNNVKFDINSTFHFTHLSHCKTVNIIQNNKVVKMENISQP